MNWGRRLTGLAALALTAFVGCGNDNSPRNGNINSDGGNMANRAPTVEFMPEMSEMEVLAGDKVDFDARAFDPDGDDIQFRYNFGDGKITEWLDESKTDHTYLVPGNYPVSVSATDNRGGIASDNAMVNVMQKQQPTPSEEPTDEPTEMPRETPTPEPRNMDPSVRFIDIQGNDISRLETVVNRDNVLLLQGADPDGDELQYATNISGELVWNTDNRFVANYNLPGNYQVTGYARDNKGGTATDLLDVIVNDEIPTGTFVNAGPDVTVERDVSYCTVFSLEHCSDFDLLFSCGENPNYLPGHSRRGFNHSEDIVSMRYFRDVDRSQVGALSGCGTVTYLSARRPFYQLGDTARLRIVGFTTDGEEVSDDAIVTFR